MTIREQALRILSVVEHRLATRVEVWRTIRAPDGSVTKQIFRGAFHAPHIDLKKEESNERE